MTITLEDVELAIKILEEFMREYRKAQRIIRQFGTVMSRNTKLEERILEMMMNNNKITSKEDIGDTDVEFTDEEKARIEELKKKLLS